MLPLEGKCLQALAVIVIVLTIDDVMFGEQRSAFNWFHTTGPFHWCGTRVWKAPVIVNLDTVLRLRTMLKQIASKRRSIMFGVDG